MNNDLADHGAIEGLGLPPIDQVGFVVRDLNQAIALYDPMFGPFATLDGSVESADFRGEEKDVELKLAFGRSGDLEIELIEWVSGYSPHAEFIQSGREGLHHLRFRVADCDADVSRLEDIGFARIWYKAMGSDIKFAYLEREGDPLVLELLQMPHSYDMA